MNLLRSLIAAAALCLSLPALAAQTACPPEASRATAFGLSTDTKPTFATNCAQFYETDTRKEYIWNGSSWSHGPQDVSLGTLISGEDQTTNVIRTELGQGLSSTQVTADAQIKASAGYVYGVACSTTAGAAATAGALTIRDALTETTPIRYTIGMPATAFVPFYIPINQTFTTGIYAGFDGTLAGVTCEVQYR